MFFLSGENGPFRYSSDKLVVKKYLEECEFRFRSSSRSYRKNQCNSNAERGALQRVFGAEAVRDECGVVSVGSCAFLKLGGISLRVKEGWAPVRRQEEKKNPG